MLADEASLLLISLVHGTFSCKEKRNTWWVWQKACHKITGIGGYSVSLCYNPTFFPLRSDERIRKTPVFLKHLSNWLMILLKKQDSCSWQCIRNGCLCSTDLQMHNEENPHYYISGVYHDVSVGFINFLEALPKECKRKTMVLYKKLCSSRPAFETLFCHFHVGRYCPPCRQALEALVGVIDEDPVFVLVVSLRVVACYHWKRNTCESWFTAFTPRTPQNWRHDILKHTNVYWG